MALRKSGLALGVLSSLLVVQGGCGGHAPLRKVAKAAESGSAPGVRARLQVLGAPVAGQPLDLLVVLRNDGTEGVAIAIEPGTWIKGYGYSEESDEIRIPFVAAYGRSHVPFSGQWVCYDWEQVRVLKPGGELLLQRQISLGGADVGVTHLFVDIQYLGVTVGAKCERARVNDVHLETVIEVRAPKKALNGRR